MKYLLNEIQTYMEGDDGFRASAANYSRAMKTEDWKFMQLTFQIIKGIMMKELLYDYKHTNSDPFDKDVTQRTYSNIVQILDFLASPEGWIREKNKFKQAYADMTKKAVSQFKRGGTK